jgi:hypothetical protein
LADVVEIHAGYCAAAPCHVKESRWLRAKPMKEKELEKSVITFVTAGHGTSRHL